MPSDAPKRDPRIDPKPGDVLSAWIYNINPNKVGRFIERRVLEVEGSRIRVQSGDLFITDTTTWWRRWAKNAEVLHAAE
jgi:myosin-crossreactive antigen